MSFKDKEEESLEERLLREKVERLQKQVWSMAGFSGEPTLICMYCNIPCRHDEKNDIIVCTKCGRDWTLESMKDECERALGIKK